MKKTVAIIVVGILIICGFGAVAFPDGICQEKMTLYFSKLLINEDDNCVTLELKGTNSVLMKHNHYMIPTRIETFIFPFGTEIKSIECIPKNLHQQTLTKELTAAPEPVLLGFTNTYQNIIRDETPMTFNGWYDYDIGTGINRHERNVIVKIQTFPVQYYPSKNSIEWVEQIEIEIQYKEPEEPIVFANEYNFLVLSPVEYANELEDLVSHKNNMGINTKLVTLDEIYQSHYFPMEGRDDQEKVKYFIKNAVEQWGITSVLLIGGYHAFPTRETHVYVEYFDVNEPFVSDLYYADIFDANGSFASWDTNNNDVFAEYDWGDSHLTDEIDLYPDIYIGRLACINEVEVTTCVNKIINYETERAYAQEWFTNLVVVGGDTFTDDIWKINEGEYVNEVVMGILDGFIPEKIWDSNGRLSGSTPSGVTEISDVINEGCGFVDFSGHGYIDQWATHPHEDERVWLPKPWGYFNSHVAKLTNGEKLPIVVLGACSTCKFDMIDDCFGWSFISNPNGGGIGSFGVTTFGYANGGGREITGGFIEEITMNIFEAYNERVDDGLSITFGDMWSASMVDYIYPNMEVRDFATLESWQSFGDPSIVVAGVSQTPEKPTKPSGTTSGKPGISYSYSSSTTDLDGDKVYYLFDWGDTNLSGWIGPYDSSETVEADHSWESKGRYQIRVKAKDTNGVQSEWSDPLPISMPINKKLIDLPFFDFLEKFPRLFPIIRSIICFKFFKCF